MGSHDRLSAEIPDIFIPPMTAANAGVTSGRNENSGMTMGAGGMHLHMRMQVHLHTHIDSLRFFVATLPKSML